MNKRTEFVERISAQMVEWDTQIDQLKFKVESAIPEVKQDYVHALSSLKIKRDQAAAKLQGISAASDHEWEELKESTEKVWDEVRADLHTAILNVK